MQATGPGRREAEFIRDFKIRFCRELGECNDDLDCDVSEYEVPEDCVYDAQNAKACLEGNFTCTDAYGLEFVRVPPVCLLVFSCPWSTGTGLFTTQPPTEGSTSDTGYSTTYPYYY